MLDQLLNFLLLAGVIYIVLTLARIQKRLAAMESGKSPLDFPVPEQESGQGDILILGDALALGYGASAWENGLAGYFEEIAPVEAYGDHRNQAIHLVTLFHTKCVQKILSQEKYRLVVVSVGLNDAKHPDFSKRLFQRNLIDIAASILPYAERIVFLDTVSFAFRYAPAGSQDRQLFDGIRRAFDHVAAAYHPEVRSVEARFQNRKSVDARKNAPNDLGYRDLYCSLYPAFRDVFAPP